MSPRFDVHLERESFGAGDMVRGTIVVTKGGRSRSIEALLEYCEETTDYKSAARTFSSGALHTGDLTEGMTFAFNVPLPVDALPNQRSEHGELYWEIQVKSDERGPDTHERRRVVVLPPAPPRPPGPPGRRAPAG